MSAVGALTKEQVQLGLENQGHSSSNAQIGAMVAAAAASGGLVIRTGGPKGTTNAPNTPRFIADSAGNIIDLDYTKGLRKTDVTATGTRGGVQYPL